MAERPGISYNSPPPIPIQGETRKSNLQNDFIDRIITPHDYHDMKERVDKELVLVKNRLNELLEQSSPYKIYIEKEIPMLKNLVEFYRKSDGATRKKILGCIFSEKLVFENERVANTPFTLPIQVILNASEVLERSKKKKEVENNLFSCFVPLTFESCNRLSDLFVYSIFKSHPVIVH